MQKNASRNRKRITQMRHLIFGFTNVFPSIDSKEEATV